MSEAFIIKALSDHAMKLEPKLPTMEPNTEAPEGVGPWQKFDYMFAKPINKGDFLTYHGYMQIGLHYPLGKGDGAANARAMAFIDHFCLPGRRPGLSLPESGVTTIIGATPDFAPGRDEGSRWLVLVKVPFMANVIGG